MALIFWFSNNSRAQGAPALAIMDGTGWASSHLFTDMPGYYSYGQLLVISIYNPIYGMHNPIYNQL